mmetsp:Transcript_50248/g.133436  ORF Transcript_50248/g.133436 Transcript_50248/m.133436 type:complete len:104 (-) Transcript_50248:422-733(-)
MDAASHMGLTRAAVGTILVQLVSCRHPAQTHTPMFLTITLRSNSASHLDAMPVTAVLIIRGREVRYASKTFTRVTVQATPRTNAAAYFDVWFIPARWSAKYTS